MFSCNDKSIFTDSVFWVVVVCAAVILWVHYSSEGCDLLGGEGCTDYC